MTYDTVKREGFATLESILKSGNVIRLIHYVDDYLMAIYEDDDLADVHDNLLSYAEALRFFENLERSGDLKAYCNGSNAAGRWIFQIYNREFIEQLVSLINRALTATESSGPVLEIMSGDGRLTDFLRPAVHREIIATDAKDGRYNIAYPKWIETLDANESVEKYKPSFIIISWEPYLSMSGIEIVQRRIPMAWIGNPKMCGHADIFDYPHFPMHSKYALSRHDSFVERKFKTDIFLFNYDKTWLNTID